MAAKLNLEIDKGATFAYDVVYKTKSTSTSVPTIIDLTGYTAKMQIRSSVTSNVVIKELTTENGGLILTPTNGKITIWMSSTETAAIAVDTAVYDLELINGTIIKRLIEGKIKFKPEVTR